MHAHTAAAAATTTTTTTTTTTKKSTLTDCVLGLMLTYLIQIKTLSFE